MSLNRKIKRGNAVISEDLINGVFVTEKKGTSKKKWRYALKKRSREAEKKYRNNVTQPLLKSDILNSKKKHIYKLKK